MQPKKQFDIKLEVLVPTTITYRITAENEADALKQLDKSALNKLSVKPNYNRQVKLKATVYQANTHMIKLSKSYR